MVCHWLCCIYVFSSCNRCGERIAISLAEATRVRKDVGEKWLEMLGIAWHCLAQLGAGNWLTKSPWEWKWLERSAEAMLSPWGVSLVLLGKPQNERRSAPPKVGACGSPRHHGQPLKQSPRVVMRFSTTDLLPHVVHTKHKHESTFKILQGYSWV